MKKFISREMISISGSVRALMTRSKFSHFSIPAPKSYTTSTQESDVLPTQNDSCTTTVETPDEKLNTMSGFELRFLELSTSGSKAYSETAPSPSASILIPHTRHLQAFLKFKQSKESASFKTEQEESADTQLSEILSLHAYLTDKKLLGSLKEFFNREDGLPNTRLLVEVIKCLGNLEDYLGAYAVIEQVKRRGLLSYLDICTPQVFSALLHATWTSTRDPYRLCQILEEMRENGICPDEDTEKLVKMATDYLNDRHLTTFRDQVSDLFLQLKPECSA